MNSKVKTSAETGPEKASYLRSKESAAPGMTALNC